MRTFKRWFDVVLAVIGLVVLWPLFIVIALLIKLDDHGPVFYKQVRVGYKGKMFRIYKFRTMVVHADKSGQFLTRAGDLRITPIGKWLRRTKIDELPQLWNVVLGHMSFVGPRPEVEKYVSVYADSQRCVLNLVPGITDPASIAYRDEGALLLRADDAESFYINVIMPDKIRRNLEYAARATVFTDVGVILKTVFRMGINREITVLATRSKDMGNEKQFRG